MNAMKITLAVLLALAVPAVAAEDSRHEKARLECDRQGEEAGNQAVAEAKLQHPGDAVRVKQQAKASKIHVCMRLAGYASGPVRSR